MHDINGDPGEIALRQLPGHGIAAPDEQNLEISGSGRVHGAGDAHGGAEVPAHDVNRYNGRVFRHTLFRGLGHNLAAAVNAA
jgi:hypothetical protein